MPRTLKWLHGAGKRCMYCIMKCNISPHFGSLTFYTLFVFWEGSRPFLPHEVLFQVRIWYGAGIREGRYGVVVGFCFRNSHHFQIVWFLSHFPLFVFPSVCDIHEHILGQKHLTFSPFYCFTEVSHSTLQARAGRKERVDMTYKCNAVFWNDLSRVILKVPRRWSKLWIVVKYIVWDTQPLNESNIVQLCHSAHCSLRSCIELP